MITLRTLSGMSALAILAACGGAETGGGTESFAAIGVSQGQTFSSSESSPTSRRLGYPISPTRGLILGVSRDAAKDQMVFEGYSRGGSDNYILFFL